MLVRIAGLLSTGELAEMRARLGGAPWADGRVTAGPQSALAKRNLQLPAEHPETLALQRIVLGALERNPAFFSAALPKRVFPPLFNRYAGELNAFGSHVDNAVRFLPGDRSTRVRTDLSATLFLSDASSYDGGELVIEDASGEQALKLDAGDLVLYPGTSVHRVEPVTRGERLASFFWIESMVRGNEERRLLYDMDRHLMHLRESVGEADPGVIGLTGTYHNLLRLWADV